jgi:hypothetical protein
MSESEKPEGDFSESDAVHTDDDGKLRAEMETLQKGGDGDEDTAELVQKSEQ